MIDNINVNVDDINIIILLTRTYFLEKLKFMYFLIKKFRS